MDTKKYFKLRMCIFLFILVNSLYWLNVSVSPMHLYSGSIHDHLILTLFYPKNTVKTMWLVDWNSDFVDLSQGPLSSRSCDTSVRTFAGLRPLSDESCRVHRHLLQFCGTICWRNRIRFLSDFFSERSPQILTSAYGNVGMAKINNLLEKYVRPLLAVWRTCL